MTAITDVWKNKKNLNELYFCNEVPCPHFHEEKDALKNGRRKYKSWKIQNGVIHSVKTYFVDIKQHSSLQMGRIVQKYRTIWQKCTTVHKLYQFSYLFQRMFPVLNYHISPPVFYLVNLVALWAESSGSHARGNFFVVNPLLSADSDSCAQNLWDECWKSSHNSSSALPSSSAITLARTTITSSSAENFRRSYEFHNHSTRAIKNTEIICSPSSSDISIVTANPWQLCFRCKLFAHLWCKGTRRVAHSSTPDVESLNQYVKVLLGEACHRLVGLKMLGTL